MKANYCSQENNRCTQRCLVAIICVFVYVFLFTVFVNASNITKKELLVTMELNRQSLQSVIGEISQQTGCVVRVDEVLVSTLVSGDFVAVSVDSFFQRALRGENISVIFDYQKKMISVRSFGLKENEITYIVSDNIGIRQSAKEKEQINQLHAMQDIQLKEYGNNPDSKEPLTGVRLDEIARIQEKQDRQLQAYENNPESKEYLTGMRLGSIKLIQNNQSSQIQDYEDNPQSIGMLSNIKLSKIKSLQLKQEHLLLVYENNALSTEPFTGLKLSEIRDRQIRQQKVIDKYPR